MQPRHILVSFPLNSMEDIIARIDGQTYNATATDIATNNGNRFWLEDDICGQPHLCSVQVIGFPLRTYLIDGEVDPRNAVPFSEVPFADDAAIVDVTKRRFRPVPTRPA